MVHAGELEPFVPVGTPSHHHIIHQDDFAGGAGVAITAPGTYVLGEDIAVAAGDGINIMVSNVTIDLKGFTLSGPGGGVGEGIGAAGALLNVEVRNGTVRAWGSHGVNVSAADNSVVADIRSQGNLGAGIIVGDNSLVTGSVAWSNGSNGIWASGTGSMIKDCVAQLNTSNGIVVG